MDVQISNSGGEHPGLARTGRADHQHETVGAGNRGCGVGLQHIETGRDRVSSTVNPVPACASSAQVRIRSSWTSTASRGEPWRRWLDPQRATIRVSTLCRVGRVQVDATFEHLVGATLDCRCPAVSRHLRHGTLQVTDRLHDVGAAPRRVLQRHRLNNLGDRQRLCRGTVGGGPLDALDETIDGPADLGRLALPPCRQIGDTEPGLAAPGVGRGFTLQGGMLLR